MCVCVWSAAVSAVFTLSLALLSAGCQDSQLLKRKNTDSLALIALIIGVFRLFVFHCHDDLLLKGGYSLFVCLPPPPTTVYQKVLEGKPSGRVQLHSHFALRTITGNSSQINPSRQLTTRKQTGKQSRVTSNANKKNSAPPPPIDMTETSRHFSE